MSTSRIAKRDFLAICDEFSTPKLTSTRFDSGDAYPGDSMRNEAATP